MKHMRTSEIQPEGVSHNPEIMKRVFLRNGEVGTVTTFGEAVLQPGQSIAAHHHETMYEVYYILEGVARFVVAGKTLEVKPGDCIVVEPNEIHEQSNPHAESVRWVYFGVAVD